MIRLTQIVLEDKKIMWNVYAQHEPERIYTFKSVEGLCFFLDSNEGKGYTYIIRFVKE